jgi:hypothetical protein
MLTAWLLQAVWSISMARIAAAIAEPGPDQSWRVILVSLEVVAEPTEAERQRRRRWKRMRLRPARLVGLF